MEIAALASVQATTPKSTDAKIDNTAKEFEAVLLAELMAPMFETVKESPLFGGDGAGAEAWRGMLHQEYAKAVAERGGVGIADAVKAELIRLQSEKMSH